jgi:hypothetical protein
MPTGYLIGRVSHGVGPLELLGNLQQRQLGISTAASNPQANRAGFGFFIEGLMLADEVIGSAGWGRQITFLDGGGNVTSLTAAAADAAFRIQKISLGVPTDVGTITFLAGTMTGVIAWSGGQVAFDTGDVVKLFAPNPADVSLADVTGTVNGLITGP